MTVRVVVTLRYALRYVRHYVTLRLGTWPLRGAPLCLELESSSLPPPVSSLVPRCWLQAASHTPPSSAQASVSPSALLAASRPSFGARAAMRF